MPNSPRPPRDCAPSAKVANRVEADAGVGDADIERVGIGERQGVIDAVDVRVLDGVEEQLAERVEQKQPNVFVDRVGAPIDPDANLDAVFLVRPVGQPLERRRQAALAQRRRKQLDAERAGGGDGLDDVGARPLQLLGAVAATGGAVNLQRRAEQQLLQVVVQRPGEALPRPLLGQDQVGGEPSQLRRLGLQLAGVGTKRVMAARHLGLDLLAPRDIERDAGDARAAVGGVAETLPML